LFRSRTLLTKEKNYQKQLDKLFCPKLKNGNTLGVQNTLQKVDNWLVLGNKATSPEDSCPEHPKGTNWVLEPMNASCPKRQPKNYFGVHSGLQQHVTGA
jgi:hypothetical protein